jgi:hypothetical protein
LVSVAARSMPNTQRRVGHIELRYPDNILGSSCL